MKATVTGIDPHCRVWAQAEASLWGVSRDHDLDEPIRLSDPVPVRLAYEDTMLERRVIADRALDLKVTHPGYCTHIAVRFYFSGGSFREVNIENVHSLSALSNSVHLEIR